MVNTQESLLHDLIHSESYEEALRWHSNRGKRIAKGEGPLAFANRAVDDSGLPVEALCASLRGAPKWFNDYVAAKLKKYEGDDTEEYPPGELPPAEERPKTLKIHDAPRDFLVIHLIEFAIMARSPGDLEAYIKRRRIPNARKYAKEIAQLYQQTRGQP